MLFRSHSDAGAAALVALQARLGHRFADPALLLRALTHRSFAAEHNERLEFLGDSVLNLAVSALLYQRLDSHNEGELSRTRANLVKQDTLHQLALGLGLPDLLRLATPIAPAPMPSTTRSHSTAPPACATS